MPASLGRLLALAVAVNVAQGCTRANPSTAARSHAYIYAFAGDDDTRPGDSDFLAVIDADPASPTYARVLATAPIGATGTMPHHTELTMPPSGQWLFANGFMSGRTFLFDLANPLAPRLAATLDSIPGFVKPHSYWRLPDGRLIATVQYGNGTRPGNPGGIALLASHGQVLETSSAADPAFPDAPIRTYSLDVSPVADRIITTSTPMDDVPSADVVQVWRLSDLHLVRTLAMPVAPGDSSFRYPFEVRFLPGGTTAFLNTYYCGFYFLSDLNTSTPHLAQVLSLPRPQNYGCGVPLLFSHYWIMPIGRAHEFLVFDIADPRKPRPVDSLMTDSTFHPHWLTRERGSNRLVATSGRNDHRVLLARFDSTRGTIAWDSTFRDPATKRLGVDFDRATWPHGATGAAMPHAAVFSASEVGTVH